MASNKRLFLSLSEEDVQKLDMLREELGMNRSQYIRYVISGQTKVLNPSIKYKELVKQLAQINLHLRVIALKESLSLEDTLAVYTSIEELKAVFLKRGTSGQLD
ncbi:MAG: ribbon-helix-helix protein, CopG family [bacterium]|nr:ribbon-helix-helix protein, CopG family [bacterium]